MSDPLKHSRSLPDHMSSTGDVVAAKIEIIVYASGAMAVHGPISEKEWCLAALEQAKDAVRNHMRPAAGLIVPSSDIDGRIKL